MSSHNKTLLLNHSSQMRVEHINDGGDGELGDHHHKPIERQVESREFKPMDDIPPSVIRYMYFVRTFITSSQQQTNSLWVGTNTGVIYIYALQFVNQQQQQQQQLTVVGAAPPPPQQSSKSSAAAAAAAATTTTCLTRTPTQTVNCLLAKEMRLKHRAPVVHIQVIDQSMQPLPGDVGLGPEPGKQG